MKIQQWILLVSGPYGNVMKSFWHNADTPVRKEELMKFAVDSCGYEEGDNLEWQLVLGSETDLI